jgi:hypothetical protein
LTGAAKRAGELALILAGYGAADRDPLGAMPPEFLYSNGKFCAQLFSRAARLFTTGSGELP